MFWVRSDLDSGKKIRVFNFGRGGCSGLGQIWTLERKLEFSIFGGGGGVFWIRSDLDSEKNFNFEGRGCVFWN